MDSNGGGWFQHFLDADLNPNAMDWCLAQVQAVHKTSPEAQRTLNESDRQMNTWTTTWSLCWWQINTNGQLSMPFLNHTDMEACTCVCIGRGPKSQTSYQDET